MPYPSGVKSYSIKTPKRKKAIKRAVRRTHSTIASSVVNSPSTANQVLLDVSKKIIEEMKQFSASDSILNNKYSVEALKYFDWERIWMEFEKNIPTLINFFRYIVPHPSENIPLICLMASQVLKSWHSQLGLVQRAVSVMLHGHGTSKQVSVDLSSLTVSQLDSRSHCHTPKSHCEIIYNVILMHYKPLSLGVHSTLRGSYTSTSIPQFTFIHSRDRVRKLIS